MNDKYTMIFEYEEKDKFWFVKFPELPGCIAHGDTPEEALKNALEVKEDWLRIAKKDGWDIKKQVLSEKE